MISLKKLQKLFEQDFRSPFLPKGFVKTRDVSDIYKKTALSIDIGDRNITIGENGDFFGAGSNVGEGREWKIERKK